MPAMPAEPERDLARLLAEESFVRELARQLVAGDADEVVQQTWLRAVQQGGHGVQQPRHWLARVLRNVVTNLRRDERRRTDRERAAAPAGLVPSSVELAEREERRRELVAAVDALPAALRTIVLLRWFDGQPPRRIAKALGLPAATVSTQLHRALALLRARLDQANGGERRAWVAPLLSFVTRPELPPAAPFVPVPAAAKTFFLGAIAMITKSKLAVCAGVMAVVAAALWWGSPMPPSTPAPAEPSASPPALVQAPLTRPVAAPPVTTAAAEREAAMPEAAAPTTGTVVVHARYAGDHTPAAGTMLLLLPAGADPLFEARRLRSDATGTARYEDVPPGRYVVGSQLLPIKRFDLAAGETKEVELCLGPGLTVTGIVVTPERVPVAGAQVEVTDTTGSYTFPEVLAVTGADGRFVARCCPEHAHVGARAPGHVASTVRYLTGREGNTAEVELVLGQDGGMLDGTVVDAHGGPVAEAIVIVGELSSTGGRDHVPPFPALLRSDAAGRFHAVGLAAGKQPIRVRTRGLAPWLGRCNIVAGVTATQRIELAAGGTVRGTVTNAEGKAVARANVQIGQWNQYLRGLDCFQTQSAADGAFELTALPFGELLLHGAHDDFGKAEALVETTAANAVVCDLRLSRGLVLRGHVVDPDGQPVPGANVWCEGEGAAGRRWSECTDAKGQFALTNCPEQGTIRIRSYATGFAEFEQRGIDPRSADLELRLQRAAARTVRILGKVVGPDGRPVTTAQVQGLPRGASDSTGLQPTDNAGQFALGPVSCDTWRVRIRSPDLPEFTTEERQLGPDATWDLGTITLPRGGRARVRLVGPMRNGAEFCVVDAATRKRFWADTSTLAAGDYLLRVMGKGVAEQALPFTIREGEDTVVDVELRQGIAQRVACDVPAGTDVHDAVLVWIQRGNAPVARAAVSYKRGEPAEVWLAPGDYTAVAELGTLRGSAAFTVGTVGGEVRITLR